MRARRGESVAYSTEEPHAGLGPPGPGVARKAGAVTAPGDLPHSPGAAARKISDPARKGVSSKAVLRAVANKTGPSQTTLRATFPVLRVGLAAAG